jgi:hypothetical protein
VIELINDGLREGTEQFRVSLGNPSGGRGLGSASAVVNIDDNDPGVGFAGNEMWVNENQGVATLTVRRGSDSSGAFTVQYATANGTARADSDYVAASWTLEFGENNERSGRLDVPRQRPHEKRRQGFSRLGARSGKSAK